VPLVEDDGSGSGCLSKFTFLVLLTLLVAGAGIVFYELDIGDIKEQFGLGNVEIIGTEAPIIDILAEENEPAFAAEDVEDIVSESDSNLSIDPSPTETEPEPVEAEPAAEPEPEEAEPVAEPEPEPEPEVAVESQFEANLENEPAEVPQESFTMRAEREAVQDAVDQVWVLTVRCVEELRGLQTIAQSQLTLESVDKIRMRLEPLREDLDELVKNTSDSVFDGALEQAAQLERNLRSVLDDLEEARTNEAEAKQIVEEEIVSEEPVSEEPVDVVEAEPTEPEVEPEAVAEPEIAAAEPEVAAAEPEVAAAEPEVAAAEPEAVAEPEVVEPVVESVPEVVEPVAEPTLEVAEPKIEAVEAEPDQPEIESIKEESVATPEVIKAIVDDVSEEDTTSNEVPRSPVVEDVNRLVEEASPAA